MATARDGNKFIAFAVGGFAAFGGFLFGYDTGYISGLKAMPYFVQVYGDQQADGSYSLPTSTDSLITSILSAGTFLGAIMSAWIGAYLGRRVGIWTYLILFAIGVAMQTAAKDIPLFAVGRVFAGLGVGGISCLVPIYQSEVSPKKYRGGIVCCYQWFITIGLLIAAIVVNSTQYRNDASCWQIPVGLQFIWAAIIAGGLVVLPESPRWLVLKGKDQKAMKAIAFLFRENVDSDAVAAEYAAIAASIQHERAAGLPSYASLLWRSNEYKLPKRVWTGIALQALQQLSGINFIFYYGTTFFQNSGISNAFLITIATNVVNVGMTVPGIWAVDKLGRRRLMIYGAAGMAVSQLIVAIVGTAIGTGNQAGQKVLVAFVCIFIAHFAAIWGPFAWVITTELVPNNARSKAMSLTTGSQWLFNFGIGYATPYMVDSGAGKAGLHAKVFFIWGGFCVVATVFAYFFIPETKGLSLEQVDLMYRHCSIVGSTGYRRKMLEENIQEEDQEAYFQAARHKHGAHPAHVEKTVSADDAKPSDLKQH